MDRPPYTLMQVLACGAQDYLVVSDCTVLVLTRSLNGAIGRTAAQERLFQDRMFPECERARVTLNSTGDAVLCADMAGNVSYLNPVAWKLTGWPLHAAKGLPLAEVFKVIDGRSRASLVQTVVSALVTDQPVTLGADCLLLGRAGGETPIADSVASIHDVAGGSPGWWWYSATPAPRG